jgi:hypothetical protein
LAARVNVRVVDNGTGQAVCNAAILYRRNAKDLSKEQARDDRWLGKTDEGGCVTFFLSRSYVRKPRLRGLLGTSEIYDWLFPDRLLVLCDGYEPLLTRIPAWLTVIDFEFAGTYDDRTKTWTISLQRLEERSEQLRV